MILFCILLSSSIVSAGVVSTNTFAAIQSEIDSTSNGGTVDLTAGITYSGSSAGINIENTNSLVIQGINGKATLDANFQSYIFTVNSSSSIITFRNISFINANSSVNPGGAILAHSTIIIENCTFTNNSGQSGAAIMLNPLVNGSNITNCNFTNN